MSFEEFAEEFGLALADFLVGDAAVLNLGPLVVVAVRVMPLNGAHDGVVRVRERRARIAILREPVAHLVLLGTGLLVRQVLVLSLAPIFSQTCYNVLDIAVHRVPQRPDPHRLMPLLKAALDLFLHVL